MKVRGSAVRTCGAGSLRSAALRCAALRSPLLSAQCCSSASLLSNTSDYWLRTLIRELSATFGSFRKRRTLISENII